MFTSGPKNATGAPSAAAGPSAAGGGAPRRVFRWCIRGLILAGAAVLACVWYSGSHVDPTVYGESELARGPITQIIAWDNNHTAVQASRLTDLPADHLWKVVTDQARFDEFMPYVRSTTVELLADDKRLEKQILDLPLGSYEVELEITLSESPPARKARWRQLNETLTFNEGAWIVERAGSKSILRYQVAADTAWLPQFAVNFALRPRLSHLLEAVENRVRNLQQSDPTYFDQ